MKKVLTNKDKGKLSDDDSEAPSGSGAEESEEVSGSEPDESVAATSNSRSIVLSTKIKKEGGEPESSWIEEGGEDESNWKVVDAPDY